MGLKPYQTKSGYTSEDVADVRKAVSQLTGTFSANDVISKVCENRGACDGWKALASLDELVMKSELAELTAGTECFGQDRQYVKAVGSSL